MLTQRLHSETFFIYKDLLLNLNVTHLLQWTYSTTIVQQNGIPNCPPFFIYSVLIFIFTIKLVFKYVKIYRYKL